MRVAICYWGLTRSTLHVAETHHRHIFDVLRKNSVHFDVFIHTWETDTQYIWWVKTNSPPDYTEHELLTPTVFRRDSQEEFIQTINFDQYYYPDAEQEWNPQLIMNHLCALESQRRSTLLCEEYAAQKNIEYTHIIYVRPDARIYSDLPVSSILSLSRNQILLPNEFNYEGYNDRFAAMRYDMRSEYSTRINKIADYRKNVSFIVSEPYLKYIIDNNYEPLFCYFHFRLVRPAGDEV